MNYKLIFKYLNDPHYFRIQILLFLPYMIYNLITEILTLINTTTFSNIIQYSTYNQIFNTINFAILLIIDVIFPLILTIIIFIIRKKKIDDINELDDIVNNKESYNLFESYCKSEFSIENLLCYQDIQKYKKSGKEAYDLYKTYLNGNSSFFEVNVQKKDYSVIHEKINLWRRDRINNPLGLDLFNNVEATVKLNLSDTLSRFILSKEYKEYVHTKKLKIELLEEKGH